MRPRLFLAALLSALALPVGATDLVGARALSRFPLPLLKQFVVVPPGGTSLTPGTTVLSAGTANTWCWLDSSKVFQCTASPIITSDLTFTGQILGDLSAASKGARFQLAADTTPTTIATWDARHFALALAGTTNTSAGCGFSYDATANTGYYTCVGPGAAWKTSAFQGLAFSFRPYNGSTAPVETLTIQTAGSIWAKQGTKTLVDATPTEFARVGVASNGRQGGIVEYCVDANDATNYQTRCGSVAFAFVNEGGTEACNQFSTPADADATPTGTLTVAFTGTSNAANTCDILANAASSLTETTLRINYQVHLRGNAATAVSNQ